LTPTRADANDHYEFFTNEYAARVLGD